MMGKTKQARIAITEAVETSSGDDLQTARRLIAAARIAVAGVVPKETVDWIDGVRYGASITLAAIEAASPKAAREGT